jgi:hypothetical protein
MALSSHCAGVVLALAATCAAHAQARSVVRGADDVAHRSVKADHSSALAPHGHSCYYWVVYGNKCEPGHTEAAVKECLACAAAHSQNLTAEGCTPSLINASCHGILPPTPPTPPTPPKPGVLELTLLPDAAKTDGAVCLDGSPAGYYWRAGVGEDAKKFLIIFNGGGW